MIYGVAGKLCAVSIGCQLEFVEGREAAAALPFGVLGSLAEQTHHLLLFLSSDFVIQPVVETLFLKGCRYGNYLYSPSPLSW
jgi:hypothetical protein